MVRVHPALKKNALRALFYGVITWTVTYALSIPAAYCVGIIIILIASGIVADLEVRIVTPRKWRPELWIAGFFYVLSVIALFLKNQAEASVIVGKYVIAIGVLVMLSDQFWGFGMERMIREASRLQAWAWKIWKYASVIVGIFATHVHYDSIYHSIFKSTGCIIEFDNERISLYAYGFLTFLALRCIQVFLIVFVIDAMTNSEKSEEAKKDSSGDEMKDERSENGESEAVK